MPDQVGQPLQTGMREARVDTDSSSLKLTDITFRYLEDTEWSKLQSVFAAFGCDIKNLRTGTKILIAEYQNHIVGFQVLEVVLHMGPVWVDSKFRGNGLWRAMQKRLENDLAHGDGYYQFGTEANHSQLTRLGLENLGWSVWCKKNRTRQR